MNGLNYPSVCVVALTLLAGASLAQDKPTTSPQKFYRLDFAIKELDAGKVLNSRGYSMQVSADGNIRTGSKVRLNDGSASWQQVDVGTSIDCRDIKEEEGGLAMRITAEVSSILEDTPGSAHPIIRQNRWGSFVIVKLKKPTVVFSSDDNASKHQMQLEVTATAIP